MSSTPTCSVYEPTIQAPCGKDAARGIYRQCPVKGCGAEVARCADHGGDGEAMELMKRHIADHAARGEYPAQPGVDAGGRRA